MGIKIIVNGYFRSGTTAMWKMMKENNQDKIIFYEPFHPQLFEYVKNEVGFNDNHGIKLWDEYRLMSDSFLRKLESEYKFGEYGFSNDFKNYLNYLEVFNGIEEDIILQPNRISFWLGEIIEHFNSIGIQIIRNPYDVYKSVTKGLNKNILKSMLYPVIKGYRRGAMNYISLIICDYIYENYKDIDNYLFKRRFFDPWKLFFIAWVNSNYYAIKNEKKIICIAYEWFILDQKKVKEKLSDINLQIDCNYFSKKNNFSGLNWISDKELLNLSRELNIEDKFKYIISKINK